MLKKAAEQFKGSATAKSMVINVMVRPMSILVNIIYTPLLLNYLGEEKYGIWVTILSIINWVNFCDIGIGNGLRNVVGKEIVDKDYSGIKSSVSTAYVILFCISFVIVVLLGIFSCFFDWGNLFNTEIDIAPIMIISFSFIGINFVLGLGKSLLYALQKSEIVAGITVCCSAIQLLGVYILGKFTTSDLLKVSILFGLSTSIVYFINDYVLAKRNLFYCPSIRNFDKHKIKILCSTGVLFLILQIGGIIMNSTDNVLVSKYFGPVVVTPFSTVARFFNAMMSFYLAFISPIWSRTNKAINENDFTWIRKIFNYLNMILVVTSLTMFLISIFFKQISMVWLGKELDYSPELIVVTVIACIGEMVSMTYSNILNGLSILKIQVFIAVFQAVVNIPLSIYLCTDGGMGIVGIKFATFIMFLISSIVYGLYLARYIHTMEGKKT